MAVVLSVLSAIAYGSADFLGGLAGARLGAARTGAGTQAIGTLAALVVVLVAAGGGPTGRGLAWGAISGVGSGVGVLALYRGLAVGPTSVVATVSGVLTVVLPALAGLALGDRLATTAAIGIAVTVPAVGLVAWRPGAGGRVREAAVCGVVAGIGFAALFVALSRAGAHAGAWPLLPGQAVSFLVAAAAARRDRSPVPRDVRGLGFVLGAGVLSVAATLLYLLATRRGELAIVAAVSALYPAATIALSRVVLRERLGRVQVVGLLAAAVGVVLISAG